MVPPASTGCGKVIFAMADEASPSWRIGIIDDDPLFRETLAGNLGDAGYGVQAWASGEAFLADLAGGSSAILANLADIAGIAVSPAGEAVARRLAAAPCPCLRRRTFQHAAAAGARVARVWELLFHDPQVRLCGFQEMGELPL